MVVRGIIELFRIVSAKKSFIERSSFSQSRTITGIVRIYGHYPVFEGNNTTFYHLVRYPRYRTLAHHCPTLRLLGVHHLRDHRIILLLCPLCCQKARPHQRPPRLGAPHLPSNARRHARLSNRQTSTSRTLVPDPRRRTLLPRPRHDGSNDNVHSLFRVLTHL